MKSIVLLFLSVLTFNVNAAVIRYDFSTETFTDNHKIGGYFVYDDVAESLLELMVLFDGPEFNFSANIEDLENPDSFSFTTADNIFGNDEGEGFSLAANDITVYTGLYGWGSADTCYFSDSGEACTGGLFTLTNSMVQERPETVPAPGVLGLLVISLFAMRYRTTRKHS
ncbi:MAG: hypothetical protein VYD53_19015 [Pseudomonadota bacterium]|nr:hypothetical protein [Pseudomonadota bacterium]